MTFQPMIGNADSPQDLYFAKGLLRSAARYQRNVASVIRPSSIRKPKRAYWSVDEARAFLESARADDDPLYAAYVLVLVLGLRRCEALGLSWNDINLDKREISILVAIHRRPDVSVPIASLAGRPGAPTAPALKP